MSSEYNKILFSQENNDLDLINYYMPDENKAQPFINHSPDNIISQDFIISPRYQEIHAGYNPSYRPINSSYKKNNKYNNNNSKSNYTKYISPKIIDCEITLEDNLYPKAEKNNVKFNFNQQKLNPINLKCNPLSSVNENRNYNNHNRVRSPNNLRRTNYSLNKVYRNNYNKDLMLKSNSVSKLNTRNPFPSPKKSKVIHANKYQNLKDCNSSNNIHPMRTIQYQYKVNQNINQANQISMSPKRNFNNVLFNSKIKGTINNTYNTGSYSTMISRSQKSLKTNNNTYSVLKEISPFNNNFNMNENGNNLNHFNTNNNMQSYHYLLDNPCPNNFGATLHPNYIINYPNTNSEYNCYIKNSNYNSKLNKMFKSSSPTLYKPRFHTNNCSDLKEITNENKNNQRFLFPSPHKKGNCMNVNIKLSQNSKEKVNQYNFIKYLSPKNTEYNSGNNNCLNNNNIQGFNSITKSSIPKVSNFSYKNLQTEFTSNNVNDISFGENFNLSKNVKNFGKFSYHKIIPSENFSSKKIYNNNIDEDDIHSCKTSRNGEDLGFTYKNNILKSSSLVKELTYEDNPSDYFSQYMFDCINKLRKNPKCFIKTLTNAMNNIAVDKNDNLYYNGKIKVALCKGKIAFDEAILYLRNTNPMEPLVFKKELCVEIPKKEKNFKSGDYLRKKINNIIKEGISIRAFWKDIIKDPQINFLLMVVDDNYIRRGAKRKDILNPDMKYIGINSGSMGNNFVCFTVLSDE